MHYGGFMAEKVRLAPPAMQNQRYLAQRRYFAASLPSLSTGSPEISVTSFCTMASAKDSKSSICKTKEPGPPHVLFVSRPGHRKRA
jgi:hypothetical protein